MPNDTTPPPDSTLGPTPGPTHGAETEGSRSTERLGLRWLFFGRDPVSRGTYALVGFGLMAFKYAVDAICVWLAAGVVWTPLDYLNPVYTVRGQALVGVSSGFMLAMAVWTLPFIWIGANMSLRRAIDAGRSPWTALLFFVPLVNYAYMLTLAVAPSAAKPWESEPLEPNGASNSNKLRSALLAAAICVAVSTLLLALNVYLTGGYGIALFLGLPFLIGLLVARLHNRDELHPLGETLGASVAALFMCSGVLLMFALEGVVCLAMATGLALPVTCLGAYLGWTLAARTGTKSDSLGYFGVALVALPLWDALETRFESRAPYAVTSSIEIHASPERVWENVVSFSDLPAPEHWLFETGIAYPLRARIEGDGVGAIRHCEFTTGAFVEPITVWDEPRHLAFDVASQPEPMEEWSFYKEIHPPHLSGYFRSVRGEFRLIPLGQGRTRLEGTTWYELDIHPHFYWRFLGDRIVHRIHARVLEHIARLSE